MSDESAAERAEALRKAGKPREALTLLLAAMRTNPLDFILWRHAGRAAADAKDHRAAVGFLQFYTRTAPRDSKALYHLAASHFQLGEYEAAAANFERVLAVRPDMLAALIPYGFALYTLGRIEEADAAHRRAMALPPDNPSNETGASLLRISRGDWEAGWRGFEARWRIKWDYDVPSWRKLETQFWTGEPAPGKTVWLHPEGGLGDTILFCRYAPLVAARAGRAAIGSVPPLDRLLRTIDGVSEVLGPDADPTDPRFLHASLWSMPFIFGHAPETVPAEVPYLHPPADGPRLPPAPPGTRLRVGLVWSGNPAADHDCDRSIPSAGALRPLFEVEGIEWVALQQGKRSEWTAELPIAPPLPVTDFADTAFVMAQLDLIVSVDTSSANLAGALGLDAWVLVPTLPEFRWPLDRPDTPWYPTVTVFRRPRTGDWPEVVARVAAALRERVTVVSERHP